MYIQVNEEKECSKCRSSRYEKVWRANEYLIRCRSCGHEKVEATLTINTGNPIPYEGLSNPQKPETF